MNHYSVRNDKSDTCAYGQIPLVRPDPNRQHVRVSGLRRGLRRVWFWLNSTTGARPDFVEDTCHVMTWPRNPQPDLLSKMADKREIIVEACSLITVACSLGAASLLLKRKRKHPAWMKKYICGTEQYGECNTLLPELVATEVVKCVQYMRMDIEIFGKGKGKGFSPSRSS